MGKFSRLTRSLKRDVVNAVVGGNLTPRPLRWRVLKAWGVDTGSVALEPRTWFGAPHVQLGADVYINSHVLFDANGGITVGDRTRIGPRVSIITSTHGIGPASQRCGEFTAAPVVIGSGCWIGTGATILPGVTIGDGCVIAAGALVTKDCEPDGLYAGVPAALLRPLQATEAPALRA